MVLTEAEALVGEKSRGTGSLMKENGWNFISTWRMSECGIETGQKAYEREENIHRAVVEAVKAVEDAPEYHSVGFGGLPNREGEVELDAAYMNGDTLRAGGVMAVQNMKNPIEAAYRLSLGQRNNFLAGEGAVQYGRRQGLVFTDMLTAEAREQYEKSEINEEELEHQEAYDGHDTVCIIGRDAQTMCCGVSTSGLFLKHPGRVGDSPFIGSGFYAASGCGAAASTGVGEDILRGCLAFAIVERLAEGIPVQKACEEVLRKHTERLRQLDGDSGSMSVIAMDPEGNVGAATNLKMFPFVVGDLKGQRRVMAVCPGENGMDIFEPTEKWWEVYQGD